MSGDERRFGGQRRGGPLAPEPGERRQSPPSPGEEAYQEVQRAVAAYGERECQLDQVIDAARDQQIGVRCVVLWPMVWIGFDEQLHDGVYYLVGDLKYEALDAISGRLYESWEHAGVFSPTGTTSNIRIGRDQTVTVSFNSGDPQTLNATCRGSMLTASVENYLGEKQVVLLFPHDGPFAQELERRP